MDKRIITPADVPVYERWYGEARRQCRDWKQHLESIRVGETVVFKGFDDSGVQNIRTSAIQLATRTRKARMEFTSRRTGPDTLAVTRTR